MDPQLNAWLDKEMAEFSGILQNFKKKQKNKAPVWMAACLLGMVALGFLAGYDLAYIMRVHFLIGCAIALFAGLCFWLPARVSNVKAVRKAYEKAMQEFFYTPAEQELFVRQMDSGNYGALNFYNVSEQTYPSRFIAGPDHWLYFDGIHAFLVRTADIQSLRKKAETTRVSYHTGTGPKGKNIAVGASIVVTYKENSVSANGRKDPEQTLFFSKGEQCQEAWDLIRKQCPQFKSWAE